MTQTNYVANIKQWFRWQPAEKCLAVTLTMKQSAHFQKLDQIAASRNLRHFLNLLNAQFFGNNFRRYNRRFEVIPVLEISNWQRLHYHMIIRLPESLDPEAVTNAIYDLWTKTKFGHGENHVSEVHSVHWLDYMTKHLNRNAEVDFENTFIRR